MRQDREILIIRYAMGNWFGDDSESYIDYHDFYNFLDTQDATIDLGDAIKDFNPNVFLLEEKEGWEYCDLNHFFRDLELEISSLTRLCANYSNI